MYCRVSEKHSSSLISAFGLHRVLLPSDCVSRSVIITEQSLRFETMTLWMWLVWIFPYIMYPTQVQALAETKRNMSWRCLIFIPTRGLSERKTLLWFDFFVEARDTDNDIIPDPASAFNFSSVHRGCSFCGIDEKPRKGIFQLRSITEVRLSSFASRPTDIDDAMSSIGSESHKSISSRIVDVIKTAIKAMELRVAFIAQWVFFFQFPQLQRKTKFKCFAYKKAHSRKKLSDKLNFHFSLIIAPSGETGELCWRCWALQNGGKGDEWCGREKFPLKMLLQARNYLFISDAGFRVLKSLIHNQPLCLGVAMNLSMQTFSSSRVCRASSGK